MLLSKGTFFLEGAGEMWKYQVPPPLSFLEENLTLSQPGGQIMPTTVLSALPDFQTLRRPCGVYRK